MLTMNLWSSVGLCNGATSTVVDIIYQNNHQPPDLPIAVIVEFENYRGPVFNESRPLCIPIYPITVTSQTEIGFQSLCDSRISPFVRTPRIKPPDEWTVRRIKPSVSIVLNGPALTSFLDY